jgi:hypothetical protein
VVPIWNGGLVNVKKTLGVVAAILAGFFVITQPAQAATSVQSIGSQLRDAGDSVITFLTGIVGP